MKQTPPAFKTLWHRAVLAMVLLAFVVPVPGRMPADEVRAAYVAAGLLCSADGQSPSHRDAHCVLCLLPASGAAPEAVDCATPQGATQVALGVNGFDLIAFTAAKSRYARAPPSSAV